MDLHKLRVKDESSIGRNDSTSAAVAVAKRRRNGQLAPLTDLHSQKTLVPALDDLALTNDEGQRLTTVTAGIKLSAVYKRACVVHIDFVAWRKRLRLSVKQ